MGNEVDFSNDRGMERTTHLNLLPRSGILELELHCLIRLHGVVLNYLSTGTTLPLHKKKTPWFLVRKRTIPTERPQPADEVSANFS
jgi:hypothetical protein